MQYLRYAFLASLAFVLVLLADANREMTTLSLLPAELNDIAPFAFQSAFLCFLCSFWASSLVSALGSRGNGYVS